MQFAVNIYNFITFDSDLLLIFMTFDDIYHSRLGDKPTGTIESL